MPAIHKLIDVALERAGIPLLFGNDEILGRCGAPGHIGIKHRTFQYVETGNQVNPLRRIDENGDIETVGIFRQIIIIAPLPVGSGRAVLTMTIISITIVVYEPKGIWETPGQ